MNKSLILGSLLATSLLSSSTALAAMDNIDISGFGSIVAGQTLSSGDVFTADWHDVGQYEDGLSFKPESMLAIQARSQLTDKLSFTALLSAKGTDDFEPEFDWYYLTYQASDNLTLMAGRRAIPMYYFSEFIEVGFAYPWVRPPANLYWWQIQYFNGLHASYDFTLGDYSSNITAFYGNERDDDNKEIGVLYSRGADRIREYWEEITGFTWSLSGDIFDLRFMHFSTATERTYIYESLGTNGLRDRDIDFYGLGGSLTLDNLAMFFDYNYVSSNIVGEFSLDPVTNMARQARVNNDDIFPTVLLTATYTIGDYVPYISYSKADHRQRQFDINSGNILPRAPGQDSDDYEQHELYSLGIRYNYTPNVAIKFQFDMFKDQGFAPQGWNFHGDSETITAGLDFVF